MPVVAIPVPPIIHRRFKLAAKRLGDSMAHAARDAILEKLDQLEKKIAEDGKSSPKERAARHTLGGVGSSTLGPTTPSTPVDSDIAEAEAKQPIATDREPETDDELLADLYGEHALRLFPVLGSDHVIERRIRLTEAVAAIRDAFPFVAPTDEQIVKTLQTHVLRLRAKQRDGEEIPKPRDVVRPLWLRVDDDETDQPPQRFESPMTGRVFDPEKIASLRDK